MGFHAGVDWYFVADFWGKTIGPIFMGQSVQEDCLTLEDGTETLSRNVGNELPIYAA
jgi:hypothetical protein